MDYISVKEIVAEWLEEKGYDGLAGEGCGCELDDLMPCVEYSPGCVAGHAGKCPDDCEHGDCNPHMLPGLSTIYKEKIT